MHPMPLLLVSLLSVVLGLGTAQATQRQSASGSDTKASRAKQADRKAVTVKRVAQKTRSAKEAGPRALGPRAKAKAKARAPAVQSIGQRRGLHAMADPLELKSGVALVLDQETQEVLYQKNDKAVLPIASLTKLMTGLLISEARLPMDEVVEITQDDVDTEKGSRSRLRVGTQLTRGELMHLSLMSSENRAAHALGRTYPGGLDHFVARMNQRAAELGMRNTRFVEPTGLSSSNRSSAQDLARLVDATHGDPLLREWSTSSFHVVDVGARPLQFNNTNRLVNSPNWQIGLQKTGYISEAGRCLVMQATVAGRQLIMVFLDSAGKFSRLGDAERVRNWLESSAVGEPRRRNTG